MTTKNKTELNPEHLKAVADAINRGPFFRYMAMQVVELGKGYSIVEGQIIDNHMNPFGSVHGGVYSSIIDTAAYWSAYCDVPEDQGFVTIDLKVDFLCPPGGRNLVVEGKRIKAGKTLFLAEAQMKDGKGRVLAHGTSKLMATGKQTMDDVLEYVNADKLPPKFL